MPVRAVLFDVYLTLLDKRFPTRAETEARWNTARDRFLGSECEWSLETFEEAAIARISGAHAEAMERGVVHPEVLWETIVAAVAEPFARLSADSALAFASALVACRREMVLMRGAAETLHRLIERGIPIGIVSNAQRYTLPELEAALAGEGLTVSCFAPDLVFWSFQHGFSKPNPHVFRILAHRCRLRGIEPGEVWMVGDNFENDVEASELHGFRAWHLTAEPTTAMAGPWMAMHQALFAALSDGAS